MITKKIRTIYQTIRYIIPNVWFNFHYLPFKQAIHLPILLYKPHLLGCSGKIILQMGGGKIKPGMIRLGFPSVSLYPNSGITFENRGTIIFKGSCSIGNNSYISVGKSGTLVFGDRFAASASLKMTSYCKIEFGDHVLVGWDNLFMDTDFHQLSTVDSSSPPLAYGAIVVGNECWFGAKCMTMKGTKIPGRCVIAANSMLNKAYDTEEASVLAGQPARVIKNGVYRNYMSDKIDYKDC